MQGKGGKGRPRALLRLLLREAFLQWQSQCRAIVFFVIKQTKVATRTPFHFLIFFLLSLEKAGGRVLRFLLVHVVYSILITPYACSVGLGSMPRRKR